MARRTILVALVLFCIGCLALWTSRQHEERTTSRVDRSAPERTREALRPEQADGPRLSAGQAIEGGPSPIGSQTRQAFEESVDLRSFVDSNLKSALGGHPEAQYYLYAALSECQSFAWAHAQGDWTTKNDWLMVKNSMPDEERQRVSESYDRCTGFLANDQEFLSGYYGADHHSEMRKWLKLAAENGQPIAKAIYSLELLTSSNPQDQQEAISLLADAALSRNAEALKYISWYYAGEDQMEQAAWAMVACSYGYECGPQSDLSKQLCSLPRACARGETATEVIFANLGPSDYGKAKQRADDLISAIETQSAAALDLTRILAFHQASAEPPVSK